MSNRLCPSQRYSPPSTFATQVGVARSQNALQHLKIEGLKVKYIGPGTDDSEAATVRTNYPVPPDVPLYYFEVHINSKGDLGFIGVGFVTDEVLLSRLPGWDPHSYGYHGDDGCAFSGSGNGTEFGPTYTTGDTIGVLLSRVDQTIRYYKNGTDLGVAFRNVQEERLFPCVGLRSRNEEVLVNLGRSSDPPFVTDLSSLMHTAKQTVKNTLQSVALPVAADGGVPLMVRLLHDHLLHHRCWKAAALLARDLQSQPATVSSQQPASTSQPSHTASTSSPALPHAAPAPQSAPAGDTLDAQMTSAEQEETHTNGHVMDRSQKADTSLMAGPSAAHITVRQSAFELITSGHILDARVLLEKHCGRELLGDRGSLDFRLKVAQFCELVRAGGPQSVEAAMAYARGVLACHSPKSPADEELLCDALSLLAYEQPANSPCGYLLSQATLGRLAEEVDRAVLESAGLPRTSALERLTAQAWVTLECLKEKNHPQALLLDTHTACFGS